MKLFGLSITRVTRPEPRAEYVTRIEFDALVKMCQRIERMKYRAGERVEPEKTEEHPPIPDDGEAEPSLLFGP